MAGVELHIKELRERVVALLTADLSTVTDSQVLVHPNPGTGANLLCYRGFVNGKIYFGAYVAAPVSVGKEYYCNPDGTGLTEIFTQDGYFSWDAVYNAVDKKIYLAGAAVESGNQSRMAVGYIDVDPASATYNQVTLTLIVADSQGNSTGPCNVANMIYDDAENNRLILGEGAPGNTTGSSYPHGAGLWTVPKSGITDDANYVRIGEMYTTDAAWAWRDLVRFDNKWYGYGEGGASYVLESTDLLSWSAITPGTQCMRPLVSSYHGVMFMLQLNAEDWTQCRVWKYDGTAWTRITTITIGAFELTTIIESSNHKLLLATDSGDNHQWYVIDPESGSTTSVLSGITGTVRAGLTSMGDVARWNGDTLYYGISQHINPSFYLSALRSITGYFGEGYVVSDREKVLVASSTSVFVELSGAGRLKVAIGATSFRYAFAIYCEVRKTHPDTAMDAMDDLLARTIKSLGAHPKLDSYVMTSPTEEVYKCYIGQGDDAIAAYKGTIHGPNKFFRIMRIKFFVETTQNGV